MNNLLVDLGGHQVWADGQFWLAWEKSAPALQDEVIRNRLHHLHLVQTAFVWFASGRDQLAFQMSTPQDFASHAALREFGKQASRQLTEFIEGVSDERLGERIELPWFEKRPPFSLTVAEALTQAIMHGQWHRGQNATRLRELGGEPPPIDLIIWYLEGPPCRRLVAFR